MAATSDTLALAAEERAKQGIHELEISFGGELDLHKHLNDCGKNPGHQKFIPIKKLTKYHIPDQNSPNYILEWIRHVSRYTVKLSVNYVSPNRPPGYPLSGRAGQRVLSTGSGYVADIPPKENDKMTCPFTNCGELPGNHEVFGFITVVTAAHVVFDDEEAKNTTVEFFYDDPDDRIRVVTARGVKVTASSVDGDFSELLCVSHDAGLVQRLNEPRRFILDTTVKIMLNNVYCNRALGLRCTNPPYTLSDHVDSRVLSGGSEYVMAVFSDTNYCIQQIPFEDFYDLPLVTPTDLVFDEEDANNAALEFFHDDPDGTINDIVGLETGVSEVPEDVFELLCLRHDNRKICPSYSLREIGQLSGRRICDLFQTLLPGIEKIKCISGAFFRFRVEIRSSDLSEALLSLVLLQLFTVEDVSKLLKRSPFGYDSLHDLLKSISFKIVDLLHLIEYELRIAELIDECWQSTSFVHLREKLTDLRGTLSQPEAENPRNHWQDILSIISGLVQFYCTVEKLEDRLFKSSELYPEFPILNRQENVITRKDTASVTVTILRRRERDAIMGCKATFLDHRSPRDYRAFGSDGKNTKCNECRSTAKELNPNDTAKEFNPNDTAKEFNPNDMFLVHIAHSHGQSKQVTIGRQTDCFTGDGFYHQLYTAPTCPGCSGGPVWMIPASGDLSQVYGVPHSGHIENELNKGCSWTVYPHQFKL